MTPAEPSKPGKRWPGYGASAGIQNSFWASIVILVFIACLIVIATSALNVSSELVSDEPASELDLAILLVECTIGTTVVAGLLFVLGANPRTRSSAATNSYKAMLAIMFLSGIVLFLGGALQIISTTDFAEQVALALVSLFFLITPLWLHFSGR